MRSDTVAALPERRSDTTLGELRAEAAIVGAIFALRELAPERRIFEYGCTGQVLVFSLGHVHHDATGHINHSEVAHDSLL